MKTPAQRRRDFVAAQKAAPDAPANAPNASAYELMLAKLASDRRRLKQVQSVEKKIAIKRELLPDYDAWVSGVLAGNSGRQDDVVSAIMVWKIDTGDYAGALDIADYVLKHKLTLPDNYARTPATLVAEEIAGAALSTFAAGETFPMAILTRTLETTYGADMPDEVRARLIKAEGLAQESVGGIDRALASFQHALSLNDKVGVKKDIERVKRAIKNSSGGQKPPGK